ncbi:O-antigen ligase family protein [Candidatus Nomurabacteria bacterium]|nr:O-antigen ligase family protein [Candidatus Nomurabacteria bacterium]
MEIVVFTLLFVFITWKRLDYGIFLFFLLLPSYLIRFHIGSIPSTLLEVMLISLIAIFFVKNPTSLYWTNLRHAFQKHSSLVYATFLFLIAATIAIMVSANQLAAIGEWKAFYIEPILFALMLILYAQHSSKNLNHFFLITIFPLILCGIFTSMLAIFQHFTGWMVPYDFWENRNTFRVTGWYGFPNAVGLFLAPLYPLALFLFASGWKKWMKLRSSLPVVEKVSVATSFLFLSFAPLAILFAKGSGPLIGLLAGLGILLLFYKKTRVLAVFLGCMLLGSILLLPTTHSLKQEIFMQNRSGQIRVDMWAETTEYLIHHPIVGTGLTSYQEKLWPYRIDKWIEIFHHPHNIFLTMWVNLGIFGLIAFIWLLVWFLKTGFLSYSKVCLSKYLFAAMVTIIIAGLVDSPYIKNDLAIVFWTFIALMLIASTRAQLELE